MKKRPLKLALNKETITLLSWFELDLAKGGRPSDTASGGECVTDNCSVNYCFTHLDTCSTCPR
jgi:hypothetical protein